MQKFTHELHVQISKRPWGLGASPDLKPKFSPLWCLAVGDTECDEHPRQHVPDMMDTYRRVATTRDGRVYGGSSDKVGKDRLVTWPSSHPDW